VLDVDLILPRPELRLLTPYPRARVTIKIEKIESRTPGTSGGKQPAGHSNFARFDL